MTELALRPATYEDLLKVPDNLVAELIDGELYTSPRPASRYARASSAIGAKLFNSFDSGDGGPGGWWIIDEPELHLAGNAIVPDLAGWRRERMPIFPDAAAFDVAPDDRILAPVAAEAQLKPSTSPRIHIVANWFEELKARAPAK